MRYHTDACFKSESDKCICGLDDYRRTKEMNEKSDSGYQAENLMEKQIVAMVRLHLENPENEFGLVTLLVNYKKQTAEELRRRIQSAYLKTPYEFGCVENKAGFDKGILHAAKICEEIERYGY